MAYNFKECNREQQPMLPHRLEKNVIGGGMAWFKSVAAKLLIALNVHHLCTMFLALLKTEVLDIPSKKRIGTRGFELLI